MATATKKSAPAKKSTRKKKAPAKVFAEPRIAPAICDCESWITTVSQPLPIANKILSNR